MYNLDVYRVLSINQPAIAVKWWHWAELDALSCRPLVAMLENLVPGAF
jgi:hypothetical protein